MPVTAACLLSGVAVTGTKCNLSVVAELESRFLEANSASIDPDLSATIEAADLGTWAWDLLQTEIHLSRRAAELLGFRERIVTFESCFARVLEDDQALTENAVRAALNGTASRFSMQYRVRVDGVVRHIESRGRIERDQAGRACRIFGLLVDVTERAAQLDELERSRQQYRLFTELASDYVYVVDLENPAPAPEIIAGSFERTTGYTPQEIAELGGWFQVIAEEDRSTFGEPWEVLRAGRPTTKEYRIRTKRGEERWLRDHVEPIRENGRLVAVMGGVQDVTEKRLLAEQLGHAQKLEALARLSGSVAHDFNNLLTIMFAATDELERVAPYHRALADLKHAATRAAELSASLLAFARKRPTVPEVVGVDDLLSRLLPIARRAVGEQVELVRDLDAVDARVLVDPSQLELAVLNLVLNASDALDGRGVVKLRSLVVDFHSSERRCPPELEAGRYACIDVSDRGPGIPPQVIGRIFEPFFTTNPVGQGTGLGLSTVHGVLRQFGGTVAVESVVGRGSTFSLYLPLSLAAPRAVTNSRVARAVGGSETIWIVEDEPLVRQMVSSVLEDVGYDVRAFSSAEELLAMPAEELARVDLLLSDIRLPGLAGTELALQVVQRHPALRVVLMSGLVDEITQLSVVSSGRFLLLQKPFSPNDVTASVRRALETSLLVP